MFENWAKRGGQPPLYLRHQGKTPFGRIVHGGADSATDLRSVAAKALSDHAHGAAVSHDRTVAQPTQSLKNQI